MKADTHGVRARHLRPATRHLSRAAGWGSRWSTDARPARLPGPSADREALPGRARRRGRHIVAPWLRGYAPSPTAGPFDFASLTGDVLALIDRRSPGRAVELVGHDWGAMITYDACVTTPERIERAVSSQSPTPSRS
ncbi:alpha/beta fold hydrolase [Streptomyces sp. MB09-02B]|uniref:alpha/beta fold hydrolase n=1 Tax=Streptomyces sp. MB09-02B TaxID=3028667 RepID=UPI0039AED7AC